jgi:hypothetical protein
MTIQRFLNLLYTMEEIAEAALKVEVQLPERTRAKIEGIRTTLDVLCDEIECREPGGPVNDPNFSVVPLDECSFSNNKNAHVFKRHYEHKGRKLMVMIHRDFYEEQCWARISSLHPTHFSWSPLGVLTKEEILEELQSVTPVIPLTPKQQSGFYNLADKLCEIARMLMFVPE